MNTIEDIPCKSCGNYYSHKKGCAYWATTGMSEAIIILEIKQRAMDDHYKLEKKIEALEKENGEFYSLYKKQDLDAANALNREMKLKSENKNLIAALRKACESFDGRYRLQYFRDSPEYQAIKHLLEDK